MTDETRSQALARIMNVQAANAAQRHVLTNDTPEPDSVSELLARAFALVDKRPAEAKTLIRTAFRLTQEALSHGDAEIPELHEAAGIVEKPEAGEWSQRKVVDRARPHLERLAQGVKGRKRDEARTAIFDVIRDAPPRMVGSYERPNATISNQLQPTKTTLLWNLVAEYEAGARS